MSDETLNQNGDEQEPIKSEEELHTDSLDGEAAENQNEENISEEEIPSGNQESDTQNEQPSSYANSFDERNTPPYYSVPVYRDRNSGAHDAERGNHINMQVKKNKPRWPIIVALCALGVYLVLTGVVAVGVVGIMKNGGITIDKNAGRIEIQSKKQSDGTIPGFNEPNVKEHLKIQDTPKSTGSASSAGKMSIKDIAKKVRPSVVGVIGESQANFGNSSVGSGIIMTSDGYILTNNHVIEGMSKISVVTDKGTKYEAIVVGADTKTDLAVLKIKATKLPAATFGDSEKLEQGDMAVAIGNPAGIQLQNTVTSGIISAINRNIVIEDRPMTLIQTDASINPGNSGGPLVNEYGQVIGINTVKIGISYYEGLGFAIPINTAKPIVDELISRGYIKGRPSIGINGTTVTERDALFLGLKEGLYVEYVHPASDAYKKGIQRGDIITKMNGTPLSSTEEIKKIRDQFKAGQKVTLTIFRSGKEHDVQIILMDEAELNKLSQSQQS